MNLMNKQNPRSQKTLPTKTILKKQNQPIGENNTLRVMKIPVTSTVKWQHSYNHMLVVLKNTMALIVMG